MIGPIRIRIPHINLPFDRTRDRTDPVLSNLVLLVVGWPAFYPTTKALSSPPFCYVPSLSFSQAQAFFWRHSFESTNHGISHPHRGTRGTERPSHAGEIRFAANPPEGVLIDRVFSRCSTWGMERFQKTPFDPSTVDSSGKPPESLSPYDFGSEMRR